MAMELMADLSPRYRRLLAPVADTADAAFVVSLDCQFLAWSWRAQQLLGYASAEILGRYCYDVLNGPGAAAECLCTVNCPLVTAARFGYSLPPFDTQIATKTNGVIWVRVSSVVLRSPHGTESAVLVQLADINRYKLVEQMTRAMAACLIDREAELPHALTEEVSAVLRMCFPELTPREADVLWQAIIGEDYQQIARALNIQPTTARNHLQRILAKLGVHSQRQALLKTTVALFTLPFTPDNQQARKLPFPADS